MRTTAAHRVGKLGTSLHALPSLNSKVLKDAAAAAVLSHHCLNRFLDASTLAAIINNEYGLDSHIKINDATIKQCFF